ncbi:hypothetical protein STEG23_010067 [Scotinomys teguina]
MKSQQHSHLNKTNIMTTPVDMSMYWEKSASMLGNLFIVLTIISDHHLHSPMYFLLANLSFLDTGVSSIATPKMIYDLFRKHKVISLNGCITQMFFIHTVGGTEMVLLIVMAYDRYIAICKPLHYLTIMSLRMCIFLLALAWIIGLIHSVAQLAFVVNLPFCGTNRMDSFYCDFPRFIKLACTDTYRLEFLITANSGFISMATFFILVVSYIFILVMVRKHSSEAKDKSHIFRRVEFLEYNRRYSSYHLPEWN